jgi:hypothetical protein
VRLPVRREAFHPEAVRQHQLVLEKPTLLVAMLERAFVVLQAKAASKLQLA